MAANFITQSSMVQPKPSLSAKTLDNPSLSRLSRLSPPSSLSFSLSFLGFFFGIQSIKGNFFFCFVLQGLVFCQKRELGLLEKHCWHRLYRTQPLQFWRIRKTARIPLSSLTIMIVLPTIFARF